MEHKTLSAALVHASQALAAHGNYNFLLAYDQEARVWCTFNMSFKADTETFMHTATARPVAWLQHQACLTALSIPDITRLTDVMVAFANTGDPIQCMPTLQAFLDELTTTPTDEAKDDAV
jgi:hypothetical protein